MLMHRQRREREITAKVGTVDRALRNADGLAWITAALMGWIGVVPLASGVFCLRPACMPIGLSTCKR